MSTKTKTCGELKQTISNLQILILLFVICCLLFVGSCRERVVPPPDKPPYIPPLPDDVALYVSIDDWEGVGLRVLNANSLELVDSLITKPGVPWTIEFSPDYENLYSIWHGIPSYIHNIYSVKLPTLEVTNRVQLKYSKHALAKSADERYLVAYGINGMDIFDRQTLSLVLQDTSDFYGKSSRIAASRNHNKIYFTRWQNRPCVGFGVYDLDSLKVTDTLTIFDKTMYPGLEDVDLVVSPDDKFMFFSAFNWRGGGGFNSFFVINISEKRIIAKYPCGPFARLAVSPDGKSVYISKAGWTLYIFPTVHHPMYRYDVETNTLSTFLKRGGSTGIAIADDNRTIFISDFSQIQKVDALSGTIFGYYTLPLDSLGQLTSHIRNIRLGKYPRQ